jgi:putative sterol carrier protein
MMSDTSTEGRDSVAKKEEIMKALQGWVTLLENDTAVAEQFEGFKKTFLIVVEDLGFSVQMVFDGTNKARLVEGAVDNPEMSLTVDSDLLLGICNGDIDPMETFMMGELKLSGNMADLQKLEVFMDLFDE